jgi:tetratricopeptide (TPR) repeat protein
MKTFYLFIIVFAAISMAGCGSAKVAEDDPAKSANDELTMKAGAPLFEGMGKFTREITTKDPGAQKYFNQGMVLAFGFNHAESIRSFKAAQKLDDTCAMCFWGEALATGPNINVTSNGKAVMSDDEKKNAWAALQKAVERKGNASQVEQDFIGALTRRYSEDIKADREPLDKAYADAMRDLHKKYPDDDEAATLFAEALMDTMPWDYWLGDGRAKPETAEVLDTLEAVIKRTPEHPLALHLYIHAVEASKDPGRAEKAADTLANLVPGSGHLVHMPAHIYWRVGRYNDASEANVRAANVDEEYIAACNAQGFYPAAYYPHNIHFLWAASSMEGRSKLAIESARRVAKNVKVEQIKEFPTVELFKTIPILALVQFGKWDDVLKEPEFPENFDYSNAIRNYARGVAYSRKGEIEKAKAERTGIAQAMKTVTVSFLDKNDYPASELLKIADKLLEGEIAMAQKKYPAAVAAFQAAVDRQDALPYTEPPFWYYPTRQSLGMALLESGDNSKAEAVYKKDLEIYPRNGWSMFGLLQSLEAQNKSDEAAEVKKKFDNVWQKSDIKLTSSRL